MPIVSRRGFLTATGAAFFSRFGLISAMAQGVSEYRALVCVFLFGGNDGNNTVVPIQTSSQSYSDYAKIRDNVALPVAQLQQIQTSDGSVYGLHPRLGPLAELYVQGKMAVLVNVGMLVQPVTRADYQKGGAPVPSNLYSHADQQSQWQTSVPSGFGNTGWGGRAADLLQPQNAPSAFPMVVSVAGNSLFCSGRQTSPATVVPNSTTTAGLQGFGTGSSPRLSAFQQLLALDNGLKLVQAANNITRAGIDQGTLLSTALTGAPALQSQFPNTSISQQLKQVARIIQVRDQLAAHRQIFFCSLGGFDTHTNEVAQQDSLFLQLGQGLRAFYDATVELGVDQQVTAFTASEFGRTCQPSSGAGADHAWGNHHLVIGGAVRGGDIYGRFPVLELSGPDDTGSRGVWIPTTSLDQYGATLARWFGVGTANLPVVFPNLPNFTSSTLGFL